MTLSIWRWSHFALALTSSLFIVLASVTGIILAFEPISNQLQDYSIDERVTVSETLQNLSNNFDEVIDLQGDENNFVIASVITATGDFETIYVNPSTGEKLANIQDKASIFNFTTNLHRSLFLKSTGRFIVGLVSFFLILMTISGLVLIARRQGGFKKFFSKVVNENFEQYYHVVVGRFVFVPILIIAATGVYLSLEKFDLLPDDEISHTNKEEDVLTSNQIAVVDFKVFNHTEITDVRKLEFPFSDDPEDYFLLTLKDKELLIHQYSGEVISEQNYPLVKLMSNLSLMLHTGRGSIVWSIVLILVCIALLFFIYSGLSMTLARRKNSSVINNKFDKDEAEYIILVGSETGSTFKFATYFYEALLDQNKKVFIASLNHYSVYNKAKQLIVFTATYGAGEAPESAGNFETVFNTVTQLNNIEYSVLGFGSLLYPDYCNYAIEVDKLLEADPKFTQKKPLFKINNQSMVAFKSWVKKWSATEGFNLSLKTQEPKTTTKVYKSYEVVKRTHLNTDDTFLLQLKPLKKLKFRSGDLFCIKPNDNEAERQYSIARIDGTIFLSIKKHDKGICSTRLSELQNEEVLNARIKQNPDFYFPKNTENILMIANGTGIAPFLGMIDENNKNKNVHLFWGGRTKESFEYYADLLEEAIANNKLSSVELAFSREGKEKIYVQDLIEKQSELVAKTLKEKGVIMICGSITMQNGVLDVLKRISLEVLHEPLSTFEINEQIKMDCY